MTPTQSAEIIDRLAYAKPLDVQEALLMAMNALRLLDLADVSDEVKHILTGSSTLYVHEREELLRAHVLRLSGVEMPDEVGEVCCMGGCEQT